MEKKFEVGEQVVIRDSVNNGRETQVRIGKILSFRDDKTAVVGISASPRASQGSFNNVRREIPVDRLQPAKELYGRSVVQPNPIHRQIGKISR